MDKIFNWISIILGIIVGVLGNVLGAFDTFLFVLAAFMIIDYITGVIKGIYMKELSSNIGFKGLLKKIIILAVVAVANLIQLLLINDLAIREIVIMFFIANEGISILENAAVIYPNIPQQLKDVLMQLRENDTDEK